MAFPLDPPSPPRAVVIGASAGAIEALSVLLPLLPANFPLPVLIVIHLRPDRRQKIAEVLAVKAKIAVREAEDKEILLPATAYLAPPDYHMMVERDGTIALTTEEPVHYSRPAIDVLFESAAIAYGGDLIGVILTGANADGAAGLRAVIDAGGTALVQEPATAIAPEMPRAALALCPAARVLTVLAIGAELGRLA